MTDAQLVELLQNRAPEELTLEEIELLRSRLAESPDLQHTLSRQLQMDQYLSAALARLNLSYRDLVGELDPPRSAPPRRWLAVLGVAACLAMIGFVGYVLYRSATQDADAGRRVVADSSEETPDKEGATDASDSDAAAKVDAEVDAAAGGDPPVEPASEERPADEPTDDASAEEMPEKSPPAEEKPEPIEGPWSGPDQLGGGIRTWSEVELQGFLVDEQRSNFSQVPLWFESARGHGHRVDIDKYQALLSGTSRLKAPWPDEGVLRLGAGYMTNLAIYFWRGDEGVAVVFSEPKPYRSMSGYIIRREGDGVKPTEWNFTASDLGRDWRGGRRGNGDILTYDFRLQDGELQVCRGDVRLLRLPFAGPPDDVIFDMSSDKVRIREIRMFRGESLPAVVDPPHPVEFESDTPAQLPWTEDLAEGAKLERLDNGSVRLETKAKQEKTSLVVTPIDPLGVYDVVCELDDISRGSGVYLATESNTNDKAPRFHFDRRSKQLTLRFEHITHSTSDVEEYIERGGPALTDKHAWVRMRFTMNRLQCWISEDGVHWGALDKPEVITLKKPIVGFGIYRAPTESDGGITLRTLRIHQFKALNSLVAEDTLRQAKAVEAGDFGLWLEQVLRTQPEGVDAETWRLASYLKTLASGIGGPLEGDIARRVLQAIVRADRPLADRRTMLRDLVAAADTMSQSASGLRWKEVAEVYEQMGRDAMRRGVVERPFTTYGPDFVQMELWTADSGKEIAVDLARSELLALVAAGKWEETRRLCNRLQVIENKDLDDMVEWAGGLADFELPERRAFRREAFDYRWRHPLSIDLSKEAFNVLAELDVTLASEAFDDACQIITRVDASESFGLLPSSGDRRLWVSLPVAVSTAIARHPQLQRTMRDEYGPLGKLRVREAINSGDVTAVETAVVQFYGTEAAAEAHLWLGDRALSAGDFTRSLGNYESALASAPVAMRSALDARRRLAASMLGRNLGEPVTGPVDLGSQQLSAKEFESLVSEMIEHRSGTASSAIRRSETVDVARAPAPSGFKVDKQSRLDGSAGRNPNHVPGEYREHHIDWLARQIGYARDTSKFYLANRFHVAAYDLNSGNRAWQIGLTDNKFDTHSWRLVPMRPVVASDRVYVRFLKEHGPSLACVNASDGKKLWTADIRQGEMVVCDPIVLSDELLVLVAHEFGRQMVLELARYESATGKLVESTPVGRFGRSWEQYPGCSVIQVGDTLIATIGGSVLCIDLDGAVRWARKQSWLSTYQQRQWWTLQVQPPVLAAGRMYVTQPGVVTLDCIDPTSGAMHWSRQIPGLWRMLGMVDDRFIVQTADELLALDPATGNQLWSRSLEDPLDAFAAGKPGGLVVSRRGETKDSGQFVPELVWVDPQSGQVQAITRLEQLKNKELQFGPLWAMDDHLRALSAGAITDPNRDIVLLKPEGKAQPPQSSPATIAWLEHLDSDFLAAARSTLPDWFPLGGPVDPQSGTMDDYRGQKQILSVKSKDAWHAIRFARRITIPEQGTPELRMMVATPPEGRAVLEVLVGDKTVFSEEINGGKTKGDWKQYRADLRQFAGQTVWVVVRQKDSEEHRGRLYWKSMVISL